MMKKQKKYHLFCFLIGIIFLLGIPFFDTGSRSLAVKNRQIRVGFYPMNGFHEYNEAGEPTGYDIDYLAKVANYTGWSYQFVPVGSREKAFELLANDKIDLLGGALKTDELLAHFEFCAYSNGTTYVSLITLKERAELIYEDFDLFSELKIGNVISSNRKEVFLDYAKQHNFTPHINDYQNMDVARLALKRNEIDAILGSALELNDTEKVIAKFDPSPFYYVMNQKDHELMTELNKAVSEIKLSHPEFESQLLKTYFPDSLSVPLTKEELDYISECPALKVGFYPSRKPISYINEDTGEAAGILPDILNLISEKSGLTFEMIPLTDSDTIAGCFERDNLDLLTGVMSDAVNRADPTCVLTEPIFMSNIALYSKEGFRFSMDQPLKIAIPFGWRDGARYVSQVYPSFQIQLYPDTIDCLNAVENGSADLLIHNTYTISYLLQKPVYNNIISIPSTSAYEDSCIAINAKASPILISILNKMTENITQKQVNQLISDNLTILESSLTLYDFIYQYWNALFVIGILILITSSTLFYIHHLRRKNEKAALENERRLTHITNNINGGVITLILNQNMTLLYANQGFWKLLGYTKEQPDGCCLASYVHPDDFLRLEVLIQKGKINETMEQELRLNHQEKDFLPVLFRGTFVYEEKKTEPLLYCVVVDITAQKKMQQMLEIEKERYQIILEQSDDIIFDLDKIKNEFTCSPNFVVKFGWQYTDLIHSKTKALESCIHPDDIKTIYQIEDQIKRGERHLSSLLRIPTRDKRYIWCRLQITCLYNGNDLLRIVGKIVDVDDAVREKEALERQSKRDTLTDLLNKTAFQDNLEMYLHDTSEREKDGFLIFLDLDHFKTLNDTLGHLTGDKAIIMVSDILRNMLPNAEAISRFGGDEFCVFIRHLSLESLKELLEQLRLALQLQFEENGQKVSISSSIGVYPFCKNETSYQSILKKADEALYMAKQTGRDQYIIYQPSS